MWYLVKGNDLFRISDWQKGLTLNPLAKALTTISSFVRCTRTSTS